MNILEFAISTEIEGEKYYREQAKINKGNRLETVCNMLATDEYNHAMILRSRKGQLKYSLNNPDSLLHKRNIFSEMGDMEIDYKPMPSQLDFYRIASEKEMQSINLYTDLLSKSDDKRDIETYKYLIDQEQQHFDVLEYLAIMLQHGEEWVESAEFGLRKEY